MSQKSSYIKFNILDKSNKNDIYINPQSVVYVKPSEYDNDPTCWIMLISSNLILVNESIESVLSKLK